MALHLIKLCVGADSIRDLQDWIKERLAEKRRKKQPPEHIHTTRMMPTRADELLDGGSLYWVIRGEIACRQALIDIREYKDKEGVRRCQLVLNSNVVPVMPRPRGPFQGWRYLNGKDAPGDLTRGAKGIAKLPEEMRRELRELGLL
ncbi:MAG TPA: DUF1489 domain-containing protein [Xanthobacteraceae bacterium]|nr:DUF1489 domain-containing protein [Xanthobacteraceae bacterium]